MPISASPTPGRGLLQPKDHTLILIDYQSQMAFATKSIDAVTLRNNAALVANAARGFRRFDDPDHGGREELLRSDLRRDHGRLSRRRDHRPHLDEYLGGCRRHQARQRDRQGPPGPRRSVDQRVHRRPDALGTRSGLRGLCHRRCLRRRLDRGARSRDGPDGAGRRAPDDLAAIPARAAARLGADRDLRDDDRHARKCGRRLWSRHRSTPRPCSARTKADRRAPGRSARRAASFGWRRTRR